MTENAIKSIVKIRCDIGLGLLNEYKNRPQ